MKIFVSSRIRELYIERKTVIEAIHFAGHTPIYIETEPIVTDERARDTMIALLSDADAFLSLYYLSEGRRTPVLNGKTPIEFELDRFLDKRRELQNDAPILMFRRVPEDVNPSHAMVHYFEDIGKSIGVKPIDFDSPDDLQARLEDVLRRYRRKKDQTHVPYKVTIRYMGPDYLGLIGKLSEVIFTTYRLNIDYISHSSSGGHATVCLSCSPRLLPGSPDSMNGVELREVLLDELERDLELATRERRLSGTASVDIAPEVVVDVEPPSALLQQFFLEIRTIDAPGQLNAICKVLREKQYNIDELQLRPTQREYPKQVTITLWLSRLDGGPADLQTEVNRIEAALQYIVGIRGFSTKAVINDELPNISKIARLRKAMVGS
jgi:hypothetical protein